jgi:hypothetical protein
MGQPDFLTFELTSKILKALLKLVVFWLDAKVSLVRA